MILALIYRLFIASTNGGGGGMMAAARNEKNRRSSKAPLINGASQFTNDGFDRDDDVDLAHRVTYAGAGGSPDKHHKRGRLFC
jgi:hypothetical protein